MTLPVRFEDVQAARRTLAGRVRHTPLIPFPALTERVGMACYLKAENLQWGGAFKIRGATNAVSRAVAGPTPPRGVVTYSSGNHAQAVALAARSFGLPAEIVMPMDAPAVKVLATEAAGGRVQRAGFTSEDRRVVAEALAAERGFLLVRPFDDPSVVAGQGTVGLEIFEDLAEVGTILTPCGGGGLTAGVALAATESNARLEVYSVEPQAAPKLDRSLREGRIVSSPPGPSLADGLRPNAPGEIPFAIARKRLAGTLVVSEAALADAVRLLAVQAHLVVEPSGAAAVAALWQGAFVPRRGPVVAVLSGGNVEPSLLARLLGS